MPVLWFVPWAFFSHLRGTWFRPIRNVVPVLGSGDVAVPSSCVATSSTVFCSTFLSTSSWLLEILCFVLISVVNLIVVNPIFFILLCTFLRLCFLDFVSGDLVVG